MATGKSASTQRRSSSRSNSSGLNRNTSQGSLKSNNAGYSTTTRKGVTTYFKSSKDAGGYSDVGGTRSSQSKGSPMFSKDSAGKVITTDSLKPTSAVTIPSLVPTKVGDYTANNAGLVGGEFGVTQTGNNLTVAPETTTETTGTDKWASYINSFNKSQQDSRDLMSEQPSMADVQRKLEKETGIKRIRQDVNNYTGQLNTITANRDANILKLEGQGRGITDVIIGGQQAAVNKEAAIQALPVQAQLAAAQGNLELAQDHINTWGQILMTDATNKYNQKKELINNLRDFTTTIELKKIEEIDKANERKYQENQALVSAKANALKQALSQPGGSAVMAAIKSATTLEEVVAATGKFNGDLLAQEAQRANIAQSYASVAASRASASASRASEAAMYGTLNGKAQTQTEKQVQGYATRMLEADGVIKAIGNNFAKPSSFFGQFAPNVLKSGDRQKFEQAQRNFINSVLRRESGAVISPDEFKNAALQYFPQPGDSEGVLTQKTQNRGTAISNLHSEGNVPLPAGPISQPLSTGTAGITTTGLKYTILSN